MQRATDVIKVADEVWVATALLHREQPNRSDFSLKEIAERLRIENLAGGIRAGVYPHISVHCVANVAPNPGRYRMLMATGPSRRRLFKAGDLAHPKRDRSKIIPQRLELPAGYHDLLDWYQLEWSVSTAAQDPLLALEGRAGHAWAGESADVFVRRMREGDQ
jgi:hypothetical protein